MRFVRYIYKKKKKLSLIRRSVEKTKIYKCIKRSASFSLVDYCVAIVCVCLFYLKIFSFCLMYNLSILLCRFLFVSYRYRCFAQLVVKVCLEVAVAVARVIRTPNSRTIIVPDRPGYRRLITRRRAIYIIVRIRKKKL